MREKNPNCKTYHVYALVTSAGIEVYDGPGANPHEGGLVSELFIIKGIAYISLKPYQMYVCKANVYTWAEMEPNIIATLKRNLITK